MNCQEEFEGKKVLINHRVRQVLLLCLASMLGSIAVLYAQKQPALQQTIKLKRTKGSISDFLQDLHKHYGINFSYDQSVITNQRLRLKKRSQTLQKLLEQLGQQANLKFIYIHGQVILKKRKRSKSPG